MGKVESRLARKVALTNRTSERLTDRKRADILMAAADVFRTLGVQAASMEAIAERAGVSKRTLYRHFPTKDVLYDVVIDRAWDDILHTPEDPPLGGDVRERLAFFLKKRLATLLDPKFLGLFRAILMDSARDPKLRRAYRRRTREVLTLGLYDVLKTEARHGHLKLSDATLELATSQLWGLVMESLFWPAVLGLQVQTHPADRERIIHSGVQVFVHHYGFQRRGRKP